MGDEGASLGGACGGDRREGRARWLCAPGGAGGAQAGRRGRTVGVPRPSCSAAAIAKRARARRGEGPASDHGFRPVPRPKSAHSASQGARCTRMPTRWDGGALIQNQLCARLCCAHRPRLSAKFAPSIMLDASNASAVVDARQPCADALGYLRPTGGPACPRHARPLAARGALPTAPRAAHRPPPPTAMRPLQGLFCVIDLKIDCHESGVYCE